MLTAKRIFSPASGFDADANILLRHPAEAAAWLWHPECAQGATAFLRFHLDFAVAARTTLRAHVSADQRFQLRIDGRGIGFGPDRCEPDAWSLHSYELTLDAGEHRIEALVWWLADKALVSRSQKLKPPVAQSTLRGGFLFAGEGDFAKMLNTGVAPWHVSDMTAAVKTVAVPFHVYHDIGPEFHIDGAAWSDASADVLAEIVVRGITGDLHGVRRPGWRLAPSALPEQARARVTKGRLRALLDASASAFPRGSDLASKTAGPEAEDWRALFSGKRALTIPPRAQRTALWDFEDYICGYARVVTAGGAGSRVRIDWAESLFASGEKKDARNKGDRAAIEGKFFHGFGDEFFPAEGAVGFPTFWWRSGRYLRVTVSTGDAPLTLRALEVISTGFPFGGAARFRCDNAPLDAAFDTAVRTLRANAHELWIDCPYYEQMAYVGDNRLTTLTGYALFSDDRLSRRMLELFDRSRRADGFVAERVPGAWQQTSVTYSLLWTLMVRDFAWWRDDAAFVRARMPGLRAMLDNANALCDRDGLLARTPGWPFVDYTPAWKQGCGPGVRDGDSSIVNLHWLLALHAAAELEDFFGEPECAALARRRAARAGAGVVARYWSETDGLFRDTRDASAPFSEHAQALAVLANLKPPGGPDAMRRWIDTWLARPGDAMTRATVYFLFYVLEALRAVKRADVFEKRIQQWRGIASAPGLLTLTESPEPARSDCHGWGAHARWHAVASLAGVRPGAPGFAHAVVEPLMGALREIDAEVRHPRGMIEVSLRRDGERLRGTVTLPGGVTGIFRWNKTELPLNGGKNAVDGLL